MDKNFFFWCMYSTCKGSVLLELELELQLSKRFYVEVGQNDAIGEAPFL